MSSKMKPVVIIALAVVCSVVAVLGVLVGLDQIATMQAKQAYTEFQIEQQTRQVQLQIEEGVQQKKEQIKYDENKELCLTLYQDVGFNEEHNSGYLKCLASGAYEALLYECAKTGYDRINCIRIIEEDTPEEVLEYLKQK